LIEKFLTLTKNLIDPDTADARIDRVMNLEKINDVSTLLHFPV